MRVANNAYHATSIKSNEQTYSSAQQVLVSTSILFWNDKGPNLSNETTLEIQGRIHPKEGG